MADIKEYFDHDLECPECHSTVTSIPAEGVPDQQLRGCPVCEAVFLQDLDAPPIPAHVPRYKARVAPRQETILVSIEGKVRLDTIDDCGTVKTAFLEGTSEKGTDGHFGLNLMSEDEEKVHALLSKLIGRRIKIEICTLD